MQPSELRDKHVVVLRKTDIAFVHVGEALDKLALVRGQGLGSRAGAEGVRGPEGV